MNLVLSLLQAIVNLDGEACVIHVGDKPYVVAPSGQVDLATRGLTFEAVNGILEQLLPVETLNALDELGAIQYEMPPHPEFNHEHFTVVAARGGDDVWAEIRRRRVLDEDRVPMEVFGPPEPIAAHAPESMQQPPADDLNVPDSGDLWLHPDEAPVEAPVEAPAEIWAEPLVEWVEAPAAAQVEPPIAARAETPIETRVEAPIAARVEAPIETRIEPPIAARVETPIETRVEPPIAARVEAPVETRIEPPIAARVETPVEAWVEPPMAARVEESPVPAPEVGQPQRPSLYAVPKFEPEAPSSEPPVPYSPSVPFAPPAVQQTPPPPVRLTPPPTASVPPPVIDRGEPAMVLPLSRNPVRGDAPAILTGSPSGTGLDRLLRMAAARGASTLYLASQVRPSIRVDGEIQTLDETALEPGDVESLLIDLMPERNRAALRSGVGTEWICDVPEVGRVRCLTLFDHRGAGGIFRLMPVRVISASQLGLSREIQALAAEPDGLLLVTGLRSSGKSTLISAFVDLINRTRHEHVITIGREIKIVHESRNSLVSQREVRGGAEEMLAVARAALRENPDVLVIDELRTADMVTVALDAAHSGQLVIAGLAAHTTAGAVDRIIDLYPADRRRHIELALAENLRGIVAQVLVRKTGGGRVAAREVLLNTSVVARVIADGKISQLPVAIEDGRREGMLPLNDALVGFVQSGTIDPREAYRRAADRTGFLALLKRQGVDVSFAERLA